MEQEFELENVLEDVLLDLHGIMEYAKLKGSKLKKKTDVKKLKFILAKKEWIRLFDPD